MKTNKKIAIGALIFLLISITWTQWVKPFCDQWLLEREKKAVAKIAVQTQTTVIPKSVTDRKWAYTFSKPEGVQGLDSQLRDNRNIPCYAKITAYDDNRFDWELIMPSIGHKAYYFWLKRRQPQGEWERDDKSNHGSWSLMPDEVSNGQPISFWGWETNPFYFCLEKNSSYAIY